MTLLILVTVLENFYKILNVPENATTKEIKKAFRNKSLNCHPDKFPNDPKKEEQFKELSEAYQTLSDAGLRSKYDANIRSNPGREQTARRREGMRTNRDEFFKDMNDYNNRKNKSQFSKSRTYTYTKTENDIFGRKQSYYKHQRPERNSYSYSSSYHFSTSDQSSNRGSQGQRSEYRRPSSSSRFQGDDPRYNPYFQQRPLTQGEKLRNILIPLVIFWLLILGANDREARYRQMMAEREYEHEMYQRKAAESGRSNIGYPYGNQSFQNELDRRSKLNQPYGYSDPNSGDRYYYEPNRSSLERRNQMMVKKKK